jgi:hypothetical protein
MGSHKDVGDIAAAGRSSAAALRELALHVLGAMVRRFRDFASSGRVQKR